MKKKFNELFEDKIMYLSKLNSSLQLDWEVSSAHVVEDGDMIWTQTGIPKTWETEKCSIKAMTMSCIHPAAESKKGAGYLSGKHNGPGKSIAAVPYG